MTGLSRNTGPRRRAPVSIRFSESERAALVARAGSRPVSTYIKGILFGGGVPPRREARSIAPDRELLGRVLAALGQSQLGDSLSRLARLAETGVLYCDPETLAGLRRASDDLRAVRVMLMQALGKEPDPNPSDAFNDAAGRVRQSSYAKGYGGRS
ncbi:hypothetical protein [Stappia indica]|uniref:hypothetical protein n=1 Tax=Stappia indica TaxID=538381 RepID=UPI00082EFD96|nr:hypothetical protein [Stappia indica]